MTADERVNVDGVQHTEQGKSPGDAIDDDLLSFGEELVDHCSEKEQMDKTPNPEGPWCGGDVGLLDIVVGVGGGGDGVDI